MGVATAAATAAVVAAAETDFLVDFPESTFYCERTIVSQEGQSLESQKDISTRNQKRLCPLFERIYFENFCRWRNNTYDPLTYHHQYHERHHQ